MKQKIKINLFGGGFLHAPSCSGWQIPKTLEWIKNSHDSAISMYVDDALEIGLSDTKSARVLGWINESPAMTNQYVQHVMANLKLYKEKYFTILTHQMDLIELDPLFRWSPPTGGWVEDINTCEKTKLISAICSNKNWLPGHQYRQQFLHQLPVYADLYGRGINEIPNKEMGLKPYMFSVAMENCVYDTYFTEKIIDCFLSKTIPIYLGTDKISDFFNPDGIIMLHPGFDYHQLSYLLYNQKLQAIEENYQIALKFQVAEDWIITKYPKLFRI